MTNEQISQINELKARAKKLSKGESIKIDLGQLGSFELMNISWQEGVSATTVDLFSEREFWKAFNAFFDKTTKAQEEKINAEITSIVAESDKLAIELSNDPDEFFINNIGY